MTRADAVARRPSVRQPSQDSRAGATCSACCARPSRSSARRRASRSPAPPWPRVPRTPTSTCGRPPRRPGRTRAADAGAADGLTAARRRPVTAHHRCGRRSRTATAGVTSGGSPVRCRCSRSRSTRSTSPRSVRSGKPSCSTRTSRARAGPNGAGRSGAGRARRSGSSRWTQPRPQRNRIHFDITVSHEEADARIAAALAAGGTLVSDAARPRVLDPRRRRGQRDLRLHLAGPRLAQRRHRRRAAGRPARRLSPTEMCTPLR